MEDILRERLLTRTMAISGDRNVNLRIFALKILNIVRTVEKGDSASEGALDQCFHDVSTALRDLEFEGIRLCKITDALKCDRLSIEARFKDIESTISETKDEIEKQMEALDKARLKKSREIALESIRKVIAALPAASQSSQEISRLESEIADLESEIAEFERVKSLRGRQTALVLDLVEEMSEMLGDDVGHRDLPKMVIEEDTKAKAVLGKRDPRSKDSGSGNSSSSSKSRPSHHSKRSRTESVKDKREPDAPPPKAPVKYEDDDEAEEGQVME